MIFVFEFRDFHMQAQFAENCCVFFNDGTKVRKIIIKSKFLIIHAVDCNLK
jgi:hypothetical protein